MPTFAFIGFGATELLIILAIVILLFGGKKLPQLARGIGESVKGLKKEAASVNDVKKELKDQAKDVRTNLAQGLSDKDKEQPKKPS